MLPQRLVHNRDLKIRGRQQLGRLPEVNLPTQAGVLELLSCVCHRGLVEDGILTVLPSCGKREYFDFLFT